MKSNIKEVVINNLLEKNKLDAFLFMSNENRLWCSNFQSSYGAIIVTREKKILLLDGRYYEDALSKKNSLLVDEIKLFQNLYASIKKVLLSEQIYKIGFESNKVTFKEGKDLNSLDDVFSFFPINTDYIRMIKEKSEIKKIERAVSITDNVFSDFMSYCKVGMTEIELVGYIIQQFYFHGASQTSFEPIVASGPNSAFPHHRPTNRVIEEGDPIVVDIGCVYDGYCSDMTRTFFVKHISPKMKEIYELVKKSQEMTIKMIELSVPYNKIDTFARNIIAQKGYSEQFSHRTGHGLGILVHERPSISENNFHDEVQIGNVFTVEPGIYIPSLGGVRIEDDVYIDNDGKIVVLGKTTKEITILNN